MSNEICQTKTKGNPPFYRGSPCGRKAVRDGFCNIHHPDTVAKRKAASAKRSEERYEQFKRESAFKFKRPMEYREALKRIAAREGDGVEIAREVLAKWGEL